MWTIEEITTAILPSDNPDLNTGFNIPLWDAEKQIGVGSTAAGEQVLIIPGQASLMSFEKKYANFSPWVNAYWVEEQANLDKIAILSCKFDYNDLGAIRAVAGIFSGLLEINRQYGTAGNAIWSLKKLFEEGLLAPNLTGVTGLIGELLVILAAPSKEKMVEVWHSNADDTYDFSWLNSRIEVKSTKTPVREHNFSSFQVPGPNGIVLQVASVKLITSEIGKNLGDIVSDVTAGLPNDLVEKVLNQCNKVLNVPAFTVTEPVVDVVSSLANIEFFAAEDIPLPLASQGVLEMHWKSSLEDVSPVTAIYPPSSFD